MIEVEFYYNPKFKEINWHFSSGFNNYFGSIKTCKFPTRSSFLKTLKKHEFTNYGAVFFIDYKIEQFDLVFLFNLDVEKNAIKFILEKS